MIRPENKRRKTHQEMLASIEVGEEIVTAGGILGKVSKISDQYLELSISEDTKIKVQKTSISAVLPKGTLKSI
jgi:preprotein translocase subunit YajC